MQKNKYFVLEKLKKSAKSLNKSPGRREISHALYFDCIKNFGSFNKAKVAAGLSINRRKCLPLDKKSMIYSKELVRIVAYLTSYGHLNKYLKGFLFSCKYIEPLERFNEDVNKQFDFNVSKIDRAYGSYGEGIQYRYFNSAIARFLHSKGVPKGDKTDTAFEIPSWIRSNKVFINEYLKLLFFCEGSKNQKYKINPNKFSIYFAMQKTKRLVFEEKLFMNSLKESLENLGIQT